MHTIRQNIISLLTEGEQGAKSVSKIIRISEKEVYAHLEHINRSLKSQKMRLKITPAVCLTCGFKFRTLDLDGETSTRSCVAFVE